MRNTTYRQPEWYRYVRAFAGDKDVVVVENPYGGVVPELVNLLSRGRGHDLLRLSLFEAAAFGANMSVPYGSWMGSTIQDAFYAPHDLACEIQEFLANNDALFGIRSGHDLAVVFSVESTRELIGRADSSDNTENATDESVQVPYRVVTRTLSAASVPYDVLLFPDGVTAPDRIDGDSLAGYASVVLPDCWHLTADQAAALRAYLDQGGLVVVVDRFGENLDSEAREALLGHPGVRRAAMDDPAALHPHRRQVEIAGAPALGVNLARLEHAVAVHLVNYDFDAESDGVAPIQDVGLTVRLPFRAETAEFVDCRGGSLRLDVTYDDGRHLVRLPEIGVYGIVVFADRDQQTSGLEGRVSS
jgi:hypothetical protein